MAQKIALGKGLASLIQNASSGIVTQTILAEEKKLENKTSMEAGPVLVSIDQIVPNPHQPRKIFKERELQELTDSIRENGIIQPLIVTKLDQGFELVAGERRLRASKLAGLEQVPVIVKRATDREKMVMAIIENVQRSDLNCVEEALAYYQLMDDFKLSQDEIAKKLGKERSSVANFLRILKLPRKVIEMLQREQLTFGHAKVLAAEKDEVKVERLANICVAKELSVRELEKLLKTSVSAEKAQKTNPFLDEKLDQFEQQLEQKTGFHINIKAKKNGAGHIVFKFGSEAEFNDIYEFLLKKMN